VWRGWQAGLWELPSQPKLLLLELRLQPPRQGFKLLIVAPPAKAIGDEKAMREWKESQRWNVANPGFLLRSRSMDDIEEVRIRYGGVTIARLPVKR
jgi:hypothetical protein